MDVLQALAIVILTTDISKALLHVKIVTCNGQLCLGTTFVLTDPLDLLIPSSNISNLKLAEAKAISHFYKFLYFLLLDS